MVDWEETFAPAIKSGKRVDHRGSREHAAGAREASGRDFGRRDSRVNYSDVGVPLIYELG